MGEKQEKYSRFVGRAVETIMNDIQGNKKFIEFKKFFPDEDELSVYLKFMESTVGGK